MSVCLTVCQSIPLCVSLIGRSDSRLPTSRNFQMDPYGLLILTISSYSAPSPESRDFGSAFERLYIETWIEKTGAFLLPFVVCMIASRLPGVISIFKDPKSVFCKYSQTGQTKILYCALTFMPQQRSQAFLARKLKRHK